MGALFAPVLLAFGWLLTIVLAFEDREILFLLRFLPSLAVFLGVERSARSPSICLGSNFHAYQDLFSCQLFRETSLIFVENFVEIMKFSSSQYELFLTFVLKL